MKDLLKLILTLIAKVICLPAYLTYLFNKCWLDNREALQGPAQLVSIMPGLTGNYVRREFYRLVLDNCSSTSCISFGVIFSDPRARVEDNVYIGPYSIIGRASIGRDAVIASRVSIISGFSQHGIKEIDTPIREQSGEYKEVVIGENTWIGEGAIVGANVGAHTVVGAGSVVTAEISPSVIVAGSPAVVIRERANQ